MVTHTRNLCSAFNPSKCTHTVVNIHPEQWAANAAAPGEQLGVRCLAQGSHLSRGIEGGESAGYSLPPPTIPARPETRTHDLRVTSPTLYPLGQWFSNLSWGLPTTAYFVCLPHLTHLIQLISSLVESARLEMGVAYERGIQNMWWLGVPRTGLRPRLNAQYRNVYLNCHYFVLISINFIINSK